MYYFLYSVVVPILLVANKTDLLMDIEAIDHIADAIAENIDAYDYLRCSAKLDKGVWQVFESVIEAAMRNHVFCRKEQRPIFKIIT